MTTMNSKDVSNQNNEDQFLDLSPDMFDDDMDVDFNVPDLEYAETSSKKMKLETPSKHCWRGVSMYEIYKSLSPWSAPEFPLVSPSSVHTVLYHISKRTGTAVSGSPPVPQKGKDIWDKDHVRLPCSSESLYTVQTSSEGQPILKKRWDIIVEALSQNITNSHELQEAILKYNSRYRTVWKFNGLHKLFNNYLDEEETQWFFNSSLPSMIKLALRLPELVQCPIPLLRQHHNRSISLTQEQILCLLANAFFCTFPRRNAIKGKSEYRNYPEINFYRLFQSTSKPVLEKLKCICNYFRRVCKHVPCGVMTFTRRTVIPTSCPEWQKSEHLVGSVPLHITSEGTIEDDGIGLLQVDFANKFLGGGVLNHGCVQEEIRFVICPELLISMLFTEYLKPTESLLMIGCERYNDYTGYADTFQWTGSHEDTTPFDASGRRRCALVAIDALYFSNSLHQYNSDLITRELNKAWVGYSHYSNDTSPTSDLTLPAVATGNWGCGAFRGSPHLKALIQLMACCLARRPMVYYTFGNTDLREDFINMYNFLSKENVTVGKLYKSLCQFQKSSATQDQLYEFLLQNFKDKEKPVLPVLSNFFKSSTTKPSATSSFLARSTSKEKSSMQVIEDTSSSSADVVEQTPESDSIRQKSDSATRVNDVEMGLHATKEQSKVSSNNHQLFDKVSHLDETSAVQQFSSSMVCPSKKHGSLSFFESQTTDKTNINNSPCTETTASSHIVQDDQSDTKSSESRFTIKDKKNSGKISDYFQRLPKKGS